MKPIKLITVLSVPALILTSASFSLTGCFEEEKKPEPGPSPDPTPWTDETPQEYINNRTFSILGLSKAGNGCLGTCWIVDDSTPNIENDYCYCIATNWHVKRGIDITDPDPFGSINYFYADNSLAKDGKIFIEDYIPFTYCISAEENDFLFNDPDISSYDDCIDMYVYNANFAAGEYMTDAIKAKLDKLNKLKASQGKINNFVAADTEEIKSKNKFVGGYPGQSDEDGTWTVWKLHDMKDFTFNIVGYKKFSVGDHLGHSVQGGNSDVTFNHYDISAQLYTTDAIELDWLGHGSSGSMLLTEDLEVCGIYWGVASDLKSQYHPFFSLFKTKNQSEAPKQDFISKWLTKK